jgi:hypothetical protein
LNILLSNTEISDIIIVALIAGSVSLVVSAIGSGATLFTNAANRRRLEREIRHKFVEKLYEIRLEVYPEAFEITQLILRRKTPMKINKRDELMAIRKRLLEWSNSKAALVLSRRSMRAFYALKNALNKQPGLKDEYTDEQVEKIWSARNQFRRCLRRDLGVLLDEDL